jgi:hypothetical protein
MSFDELASRMGKRHRVSPELIADPAAFARRSERIRSLGMLLFGIWLTVVVSALTIWLAEDGWTWPTVSGPLIFIGGIVIFTGAKGLLKGHRAPSP